MDEILERARSLGEAIAQHPLCGRLKDAWAAVEADADASRLEAAFTDEATRLQARLDAGEEPGPRMERAEQRLQEMIDSNAKLAAYLDAQTEFRELMEKVDNALGEAIGFDLEIDG